MTPIPLTPEEDELLYILEGRRPQDFERFQSLVALLMERHWYALVTYILDPQVFLVLTFHQGESGSCVDRSSSR